MTDHPTAALDDVVHQRHPPGILTVVVEKGRALVDRRAGQA
ncbi:MAG: hypothetical protein ABIQ18_04080 [Umezawaea sp.]